MSRPVVKTKLLIRGNLRLRDIEEIMMKLRDEFNILDFRLQIDDDWSMNNSRNYQEITLEKVNRIRKRDSKGRYTKEILVISEGKDK